MANTKQKVLYVVEAMGGGVFTYIVDLANQLVNEYDMYIAYAVCHHQLVFEFSGAYATRMAVVA